MSLLWSSALAVGIDEIDDQHRELFERINKMLDIIGRSGESKDMGQVMSFLEDYIVSHFAMEEGWMIRFNYPDFQQHKERHEGFSREFGLFKDRLAREGPSAFLAIQVESMLVEWWTNHIRTIDTALGKFLADKV